MADSEWILGNPVYIEDEEEWVLAEPAVLVDNTTPPLEVYVYDTEPY